jgi:DNA polymerase-3 subunit delta'
MKDIIGQERVKSFLLQLAASERVPHALLFLGNTGSGNLALASAFAQVLQCEKSGTGLFQADNNDLEDACGVCSACRKAAAFVHPDIHFSFPTVGTNAVSNDYIKEWRKFLGETPYSDANDWLQRLNAENKQGNITKEGPSFKYKFNTFGGQTIYRQQTSEQSNRDNRNYAY